MDENLYEILHVSPNAPKEVIVKAYEALIIKYNSEFNKVEKEEFHNLISSLNNAKNILTNDDLRKQYDLEINSESNDFINNYVYDDFKEVTQQAHPWMRYFARGVDSIINFYVAAIVIGIFLIFISEDLFNAFYEMNDILFIIICSVVGLSIESAVISIFGTTIGKWVFSIKVIDIKGKKLKPNISLKRNFLMYYKGLGLGIPIISLITMLFSFNQLNEEPVGRTSWDINCNTLVIVGDKNIFKIIIAGISFCFYIYFLYFLV